ncbi:MAG: NADH-quinone oxidoreductase subunit C [Lutimonas sp.]
MMTHQEIQELVSSWSEQLEFTEEASAFLNVTVPKELLFEICTKLRETPALDFDYLFCLTGIDYGEKLGVIYHLESIENKHSIVLKVSTEDRETPELDTVSSIWRTAEFHEMEVYDFLGITFKNHPNMKRLFLPPEWDGFPLRKDYIDEANMVIK